MDEMNLLTAMRDEIPLTQASPAAQRLFRSGRTEIEQSERARPARPRVRLLSGGAGAHGLPRWWKLAVPGVLAVGLAAALAAIFLPRGTGTSAGPAAEGPPAGVTMSAQVLADIAGKAVLSQQPVKPDQWVYQKIETYSAPVSGISHTRPSKPVQIQTQWVMADGANAQWGPVDGHMIGGLVLTGPPAKGDEKILAAAAASYAKLGSLPKDPAALEAYFAGKTAYPHPTPVLRAEQAYSAIQSMLSSEILPPGLTAELYHALADVPGVIAKKNVKDISGQTGVEFILPQSPYNVNLGTILSATTYQYLGQATWSGHPPYVWEKDGQSSGSYDEEVLLAQALVSGPGKLPAGQAGIS
jgi:hypothetical protein